MGSMMMINYLFYAVQLVGFIAILPFLAVGFALVKLMGGDPMSMDGMGIDFVIMIMTALIAAIATGAFLLGKFI
jgi:hypothetical protein